MFSLPLSKEQTEFIIPQKQPFVLITSLIKADETGCETSFTTSENHLLLQGTRLSSCGIIKNIAQSCATMMGFVNAAQDSKPKVGFIIYTRSFQCSKLPGVGETIYTTIQIDNQVFDVTIIEGKFLIEWRTDSIIQNENICET